MDRGACGSVGLVSLGSDVATGHSVKIRNLYKDFHEMSPGQYIRQALAKPGVRLEWGGGIPRGSYGVCSLVESGSGQTSPPSGTSCLLSTMYRRMASYSASERVPGASCGMAIRRYLSSSPTVV